MAKMTRAKALTAIKSYAAQGDTASATRIFCENRISREAYNQAVREGQALARFVAERDAENAAKAQQGAE